MIFTKAALLAALIGGTVSTSSSAAVEKACQRLDTALPGKVGYPNSEIYSTGNSYWSVRQSELFPSCIVTPHSTRDVSGIIKILVNCETPFSVKSGGHAAFPGGSNVEGGVTIDLSHLNTIEIAKDRKSVTIGAGNRWIDISTKLDVEKLAVVGGRVASVGTSGLLLGGGISYFSERRGWGCDNVRKYTMVTSSGEVVTATADKNKDLYWALRGGSGSNFGLVTTYELEAFEQGDLWSRSMIFPGALNASLIPVVSETVLEGLPEDKDAHFFFIMTYQAQLGGWITASSLYHATAKEGETPDVYKGFDEYKDSALLDEIVVANISSQSQAIQDPAGRRQSFAVTSVKLEGAISFLQETAQLYVEAAQPLINAAKNSSFTPYLVFQPISANVLAHMQKNGGNALGLFPEDGPLVMVQFTTTWEDERLDDMVRQVNNDFLKSVEERSEEAGLGRGFVYMNYADEDQEPLKRYGKEQFERLKRTSKAYDPERKLQKLWKGYFQLGE